MRYLFGLLLLIALESGAQIWEDFSDGNISLDPAWTGEHQKFKVSNSSAVPANMRPALQLDDEGADTAFLSLEQDVFPSMQWEFWVKLSFNTSASNFVRVYVVSDHENPVKAENGFFLQVGGGQDSVWFGKQDAAGILPLYILPELSTSNSTNSMRIKILKTIEGQWEFYGDPAGEYAFIDLGNIQTDDTIGGTFFSLNCFYTSSNSTKFYFDDIYSGPLIVDTILPVLKQVNVVSHTELKLMFSEPVDDSSSSFIGNYTLSGSIGNPYEAFRMLNPEFVMLFFENEITEGVSYQIHIAGVTDISGNSIRDTVAEILWYDPKPYDIIINEIMADPSPPVMLPEYEYIELFNRSEYRVGLEGWNLEVAGKTYEIGPVYIEPYAFLLLMENDALPDFQFSGPSTGFPSFSVSNESAEITLLNREEKVICHTSFNVRKYSDAEKSNGGWSLEQTDPWYPCLDEKSWRASVDPIGGTPGKENSILTIAEMPLSINTACSISDSSVLVKFNASMDQGSLANHILYKADHGLGQPDSAWLTGEKADEVILTFKEKFSIGIFYELVVSPELLDCVGNPAGKELVAVFSLPSACEPFEVIFNEILFNPLADGAEYIELYNRSKKTVHLDDLRVAYVKEIPPNPPDTTFYFVSNNCKPLGPGEYIALSKSPERISSQYHIQNESALFLTDPFPQLNNDHGTLLLVDEANITIDRLDYNEEMHYPLLGSFTGVSLERMCSEIHCNGPDNWHSASSVSGFGTPGYVNSQHLEGTINENVLEVFPEVFTPDGDGREDVLEISCSFNESGMLIRIFIFNEEGWLARSLVNNSLAGTENTYFWDGLTDEHGLAPTGVYIILLECISMNGYSKKYKKVAALL
jgi:hypothetical protein